MKLMKKIGCKIGRHQWGTWEYVSVDSCQKVRYCKQCNEKQLEESIEHIWSEWQYKNETSCRLVQLCQRCGKSKESEQIKHIWSEWQYENETSCRLVQLCQRCGKSKESEQIKHVWSEWQYENETSCRLVQLCQRCGHKVSGEIKHTWEEWQYEYKSESFCIKRRSCQRCHEIEEYETEHVWGELQYESEYSCKLARRCQQCNTLRELSKTKHIWEEWQYETDTSCELIQLCQRCGEPNKLFQIKHIWSEWHYESQNPCQLQRVCQRCKKIEQKEIQHQWSDWKYINIQDPKYCKQERICRRCNVHEEKKTFHRFETREEWQGLQGYTIEKCFYCNYIERKDQRVCPKCGENREFRIQENLDCGWFCIVCQKFQKIENDSVKSSKNSVREKEKIAGYIELKEKQQVIANTPPIWKVMKWIQQEFEVYGNITQKAHHEIGKTGVKDIYKISFHDSIMELQHKQIKYLTLDIGSSTAFDTWKFSLDLRHVSSEVRVVLRNESEKQSLHLVNAYLVLYNLPEYGKIKVEKSSEVLKALKSSYDFKDDAGQDEEASIEIGIKDRKKATQLAIAFEDVIHRLKGDEAEQGVCTRT